MSKKGKGMMLKLGSTHSEARAMHGDDIFLSRLKLLIIAAKAYLRDYPLGTYRKQAVAKNAQTILKVLAQEVSFKHRLRRLNRSLNRMDIDYLLNERVKLLAFMAQAFAEDYPIGYHRKRVIENNIEYICDQMQIENVSLDAEFLKVA
jgi:hypothetical protein